MGPIETESFRASLGLRLEGAPNGIAQTPLVTIAAGLRNRGVDVDVLTLDATIDTPVSFSEGGVSLTYCPVRGAPKYRARERSLDLFEKEIRHMTEAIDKIQPDIIHAHWTYEYAEAAVRSGKPHLVTMHDLGWDYFWIFRDLYRFMRLVMKYRTMPRVKHLTAVAPFMANKAWQYLYFKPVAVIPNGVKVPPLGNDLVAAKANLPLKLVSVGNASRIKNISKSMAAFKLILEKFPDAELHLFGPGLDEHYVQKARNVIAHGNVPNNDLIQFLRNEAAILIHPSLLETFGVIIIEAKVNGVPVVCGSNSGGTVFANGISEGGMNVNVENPAEIAQAVFDLMTSKEAYLVESKKSYDYVKKHFDIDLVCSKYLEIYKSILSLKDGRDAR